MAHSWGTVIGLGAALKQPDLFYAYVGIGQVINTRDNERISFEYGLQQAKAHGNAAAVKELESIAPYPGDQPITRERIILARKWAQFYGGLSALSRGVAVLLQGAAAVARVLGGRRVRGRPGQCLHARQRAAGVPERRLQGRPLVVDSGLHVHGTSRLHDAGAADGRLAGARCSAPAKQGVWFERSSHMIPWEEPGKMLMSLVQYVRPLAEPKRSARRTRIDADNTNELRPLLHSPGRPALASCTAATPRVRLRRRRRAGAESQARQPYRSSEPQGAGGAAGAHLRPVPRHPLPPRACAVARGEAAVRGDVLPSRQVSDRAGAHRTR